ncbi:hypothetical protein [Undibacterium squillarum]|uniref:hypothetical protein n=1 Tax=Undibacterium squillarum TaxID=1131567 RepID=UPI0035AD955A
MPAKSTANFMRCFFVFQLAETTFYAGIVIVDFRKSGLSADERCTAVLNAAFTGFSAKKSALQAGQL